MSENRRLPALVIALGVVSLLNDFSAEMIYPLLPLFLTRDLGAGPALLGLIEGVADSTSCLVTLLSGVWADSAKDRSRLVLGGYALASAARSLIALAPSPVAVFVIRVADRLGKGVRTPARDALVGDSVEPERHGLVYGFHRAMDNAGSIVGPLAASALLYLGVRKLRSLFALAALPAAATVAVVLWKVREPDGRRDGQARPLRLEPPPPAIRRYLAVMALFTLSESSDAFLLLRATDLGVPSAALPLLWSAFHVVKTTGGVPAGGLSDRVGRKPVIAAGWLIYALSYLGFAFATRAWQVWALFGFYGLFYALTEGPERALMADLARHGGRGSAFGWFNFIEGVSLLLASVLFGMVWQSYGAKAAFCVGAALALTATAALLSTSLAPSGPPKPAQ